jgi:tRNA modification GTPase
LGIKRTFEKIDQAQVVIYLLDGIKFKVQGSNHISEIEKIRNKYPLKPLVIVVNKVDVVAEADIKNIREQLEILSLKLETISAKNKTGIEELKNTLLSFVNTGALRNNETIVTNTRHYDALLKALEEIQKVKQGLLFGLPSDLMAIDIRQALYHLGEITGQVSNDELLGNIFANFCIGK